jgi:hypothetical protein
MLTESQSIVVPRGAELHLNQKDLADLEHAQTGEFSINPAMFDDINSGAARASQTNEKPSKSKLSPEELQSIQDAIEELNCMLNEYKNIPKTFQSAAETRKKVKLRIETKDPDPSIKITLENMINALENLIGILEGSQTTFKRLHKFRNKREIATVKSELSDLKNLLGQFKRIGSATEYEFQLNIKERYGRLRSSEMIVKLIELMANPDNINPASSRTVISDSGIPAPDFLYGRFVVLYDDLKTSKIIE